MSTLLPRRRFLRASASIGVLAALGHGSLRAVEPFARSSRSRLRLSLAAYSFGDHFKPGKDGSPARMDMKRFVDYCADHGCGGAELTSYYFPDRVDDAYLREVRRHAHLRGVTVSGTAVGNDFCHPPGAKRSAEVSSVKEWIRKAAILGAPHIRVFAGGTHGTSEAEAARLTIEALEECGEEAGKAGIFLGVENHGGIVRRAESLVDIVKAVRSPWVGINLDTGNFYSSDPYRELALCAPWAVNVQFKGKVHVGGKPAVEKADYARTFKILRDAGYQEFVALEYEFKEDPFVRVPQMLEEMRPLLD
ncbi:MAG: sugar phosphate isomerase/epimerase [Verrucomicrobium sp.]|nr:sugar phosphate isomerase/epimerase [Verrucomicrobium sp.]